MPVANDSVRRESDHREDGLRGAAFHSEKTNRLKYTLAVVGVIPDAACKVVSIALPRGPKTLAARGILGRVEV